VVSSGKPMDHIRVVNFTIVTTTEKQVVMWAGGGGALGAHNPLVRDYEQSSGQ
jgi:hypothetical protein